MDSKFLKKSESIGFSEEGNKLRLSTIDIWQIFYLLLIYALTYSTGRVNIFTFIVLLLGAIPFINCTERLLEICLVISPIAYFFTGADEGVLSIYTFYGIFLLIRYAVTKKIRKPNGIWLRILLVVVIIISYQKSALAMSSGMYELIYVILISILVSYIGEFDEIAPFPNFSKLCIIGLSFYFGVLIIHPFVEYGRYSISSDVNVNTLGLSLAIMTVSIAVDLIYNWKGNFHLFRLVTIGLGLVMILLTGSRNSLLAVIGSVVIILLAKGYREKRIGKAILLLSGIGLFILVVIATVLSSGVGIDASRLSIASVIRSGGTNRIHVWTEVIPYVWNNSLWWGLGPGKYSSHVVLQSLVQRSYSHTHNTLIESFAELGLVGFSITLLIVLTSFRQILRMTRFNANWYKFAAYFLCVMIASIGESYFNDIVLWIPIGIICSTRIMKSY